MASPSSRVLVGLAVAFAAGLGSVVTLYVARTPPPPEPKFTVQPPAKGSVKYVCPMHPAVIRDEPGNCPICGMKLVKQETSVATSEVDGLVVVKIDARQQQLIGLETMKVGRGRVDRTIRAPAKVGVDETKVRRINLKIPGYVERVFVDFVGKPVRRGQPLFSVFSPELVAAENEYLAARAGGGPLLSAVRRRLELWDVPQAELDRLDREGTASREVTFVSPVSGVVTRKEVVQGARVEAGAMPYEVTDLSTVWVMADLYEDELRLAKVGATAQLSLASLPGRTIEGVIAFIEPMVDEQTRTVRARLSVPNPGGELLPGQFGELLIDQEPLEVLRVPTDALVFSGTETFAFRVKEAGHFEPVKVQVGSSGREWTEVLKGLDEGDQVVSRATFLVDSESRLRASLARVAGQATGQVAP